MTGSTKFRYSTGILDPDDAPDFKWEYPVPVNEFWNTFKYTSGRNFLTCFSQDEIDNMRLEKHNELSNKEKASILLTIVEDKIVSLGSPDHPLWETDFTTWQTLMQAKISIYGELELLDDEIKAEEQVIEKRGDKAIPAHSHGLAYLLSKRGLPGDFKRSEELEKNALEWFDANLGKDSPQAMSVRRVIATAVWGQERYAEAEKLMTEMSEMIGNLNLGEYGAYQDEERQLLNELVEELKRSETKTPSNT